MSASADPRSRLTDQEQAAMQRLLDVAGRDTGQSKKVADFLLAWWNAEENGGWDIVDLWSVDRAIANDMFVVLHMVARTQAYPDSLGYGNEFDTLVKAWRPRAAT